MTVRLWASGQAAAYRFRHLLPGLLESEHNVVVEGGADLQHAVEVVQAARDVRHCGPLLDGGNAGRDIIATHDLTDDQ